VTGRALRLAPPIVRRWFCRLADGQNLPLRPQPIFLVPAGLTAFRLPDLPRQTGDFIMIKNRFLFGGCIHNQSIRLLFSCLLGSNDFAGTFPRRPAIRWMHRLRMRHDELPGTVSVFLPCPESSSRSSLARVTKKSKCARAAAAFNCGSLPHEASDRHHLKAKAIFRRAGGWCEMVQTQVHAGQSEPQRAGAQLAEISETSN